MGQRGRSLPPNFRARPVTPPGAVRMRWSLNLLQEPHDTVIPVRLKGGCVLTATMGPTQGPNLIDPKVAHLIHYTASFDGQNTTELKAGNAVEPNFTFRFGDTTAYSNYRSDVLLDANFLTSRNFHSYVETAPRRGVLLSDKYEIEYRVRPWFPTWQTN